MCHFRTHLTINGPFFLPRPLPFTIATTTPIISSSSATGPDDDNDHHHHHPQGNAAVIHHYAIAGAMSSHRPTLLLVPRTYIYTLFVPQHSPAQFTLTRSLLTPRSCCAAAAAGGSLEAAEEYDQ